MATNEAKTAATIDARRFRETARKAVEKYEERGMVVDAIVWGRIVGEYEALIEQLRASLVRALGQLTDDDTGHPYMAVDSACVKMMRKALAAAEVSR